MGLPVRPDEIPLAAYQQSLNLNLPHDVVGLDRDRLERQRDCRAIARQGDRTSDDAHADVQLSRTLNLLLTEKQDEAVQIQFHLAIEVARAFQEEQADEITSKP